MKRSKAADLIDEARALLYDHTKPAHNRIAHLQLLFERFNVGKLEECGGEAHSNAHIDNCSRCAPRWGWVGKKEPVT